MARIAISATVDGSPVTRYAERIEGFPANAQLDVHVLVPLADDPDDTVSRKVTCGTDDFSAAATATGVTGQQFLQFIAAAASHAYQAQIDS